MSLMMYVPKAIIKKVVLTWNMQIYLKTSGSNMRIVLKLTTNISFFAVLIISLIHSIIFTLPLNMSDKGPSFTTFDKKTFICWAWKASFRRVSSEIRSVVWGTWEMSSTESRDTVVGDILVDLCVKSLSMHGPLCLYCFNLSNSGNRSPTLFI